MLAELYRGVPCVCLDAHFVIAVVVEGSAEVGYCAHLENACLCDVAEGKAVSVVAS